MPAHTGTSELLPHFFTLATPKRGGNFLWPYLFPTLFSVGTFPLGSTMPCVARTFLCLFIGDSDKTVCTAGQR